MRKLIAGFFAFVSILATFQAQARSKESVAIWAHYYRSSGCHNLQTAILTIAQQHLKKRAKILSLEHRLPTIHPGSFKSFYLGQIKKKIAEAGHRWFIEVACKESSKDLYQYAFKLFKIGVSRPSMLMHGYSPVRKEAQLRLLKSNIRLGLTWLPSRLKTTNPTYPNHFLRKVLSLVGEKPVHRNRVAGIQYPYSGKCARDQYVIFSTLSYSLRRPLLQFKLSHPKLVGMKSFKPIVRRQVHKAIYALSAIKMAGYFFEVHCRIINGKAVSKVILGIGTKERTTRFSIEQVKLYGSYRHIAANLNMLEMLHYNLKAYGVTRFKLSIPSIEEVSKHLKISKAALQEKSSDVIFGLGAGFNIFGSARSIRLNSHLGCAIGSMRSKFNVGFALSGCLGHSSSTSFFGLDILTNLELTLTLFDIRFGGLHKFSVLFNPGFVYYLGGFAVRAGQSGSFSRHIGFSTAISVEYKSNRTPIKLGIKISWMPGLLQTANQNDYWDWGRINSQFFILFGN